MVASYWGAREALALAMPKTASAGLLLLLYLLLFSYLLYHGRKSLPRAASSRGLALLALIIASLAASLLLPIRFQSSLPLFGSQESASTVALFSALPYLLTGVVFGPASALLVGFSTGFGRALGQSHQLNEVFHFAFGAWFGAVLMRQSYQGQLYRILRFPVTAGALSGASIALMAGFAAFVTTSTSPLLRLDAGLMAFTAGLAPQVLEGLAGGAVLFLLLRVVSELRPRGEAVPAPGQRSVHDYLVTNILLFGLAALLLSFLSAFTVSMIWSTQLQVARLAAAANASTLEIVALQEEMQTTLESFGRQGEARENGEVSARTLGQFYRSSQTFDEILLVDHEFAILDAVSKHADEGQVTVAERIAIQKASSARSGAAATILTGDPAQGVSIVVPISIPGEGESGALIGRVTPETFRRSFSLLTDDYAGRSTAVLSAAGATLVQSDDTMNPMVWEQTRRPSAGAGVLPVPEEFSGAAHLTSHGGDGRHLLYIGPSTAQSWRVAVAIPFTDVLRQALFAALPLTLALMALTGAFYVRTTAYGRNLSRPLAELTEASRTVAIGGPLPNRPRGERTDEIGALERAFAEMQLALRARLEELSLLLTVSQESSGSIDLEDTIPVVLQGAIRGTGAAAARAVVLNPNSGTPLTFAVGSSASAMAPLDRPLMTLVREKQEIVLDGEAAIAAFPTLAQMRQTPFKALYALCLQSNAGFQGFLVLGFRQPRSAMSDSEFALLRTLAGQASHLIDKNYLFANAEGGRRRLAAVLASTSEAVIVTDQSARVLIINRAFEQAFGVKAGNVVGRSVSDVVHSASLVAVLADFDPVRRNVEVQGLDRHTYVANASPIASHEGQILGRVAVLHDITHLKELDRVKSEFVDNVSHDLRTPLTVLSGYATALSMLHDLTPEQRDYSNHILSSVDRMIVLVENLLDLGRIEAGVDLVFEDVQIPELLAGLADEHWLYAHDAGITLHIRTADSLPSIRGDLVLLNQAVSNLLTNAFKYAPQSGELTLAVDQVGEEVVISVRDRGPGIAGQDQLHLFEKFYRVKRHGAGKAKGSGLGLAIVKSIAERHNGRVWCESKLGQGSTFFLAIPVSDEA